MGSDNPLSEWVENNVALCGKSSSTCKGWDSKGEWTCKHYIQYAQFKTKIGTDNSKPLCNSDQAGTCKDLEQATGRQMIEKLTQNVANAKADGSRLRKVFPGMRWKIDEGNEAGMEAQFSDDE